MNLPTREECLQLLREYKNPENIIEHSLVVAKIANYLAKRLKEKGEDVDRDLVDRGALLHDIVKFITLNSDARHGKEGYKILMEKGYPAIALIAKEHALSEILKKGSLKSWESKIVYYADKRVNNERIVSLEERFKYLRERYGKSGKEIMDKINKCELPCILLEEEIFNKIDADKGLKELK